MKTYGNGNCAVEGCETAARRGQLMCRADWFRVSAATRAAVNAAYRDYLANRITLGALRDAQERAIREADA